MRLTTSGFQKKKKPPMECDPVGYGRVLALRNYTRNLNATGILACLYIHFPRPDLGNIEFSFPWPFIAMAHISFLDFSFVGMAV